jgi:hypothetical protein
VKICRRLQRLGAVAIKNAVYVLPFTEQASEDFQWLRKEIGAGGGEASVCRAAFVDGLSDQQIETMFRTARDAEYAQLVTAAESGANPADLERRLRDVAVLDHFGAPGRHAAEAAIAKLRSGLPAVRERSHQPAPPGTWVTRPGVHVDRIASAWLIRRFIDHAARFDFVENQRGPIRGAFRFDMFDAEYTHEGDRCTFETLLARFNLADDRALRVIGEMVHDVDCKDDKFGRAETPGFERLIAGIVRRNSSDEARLERGAQALDDLYESFGGTGAPLRRSGGTGGRERTPKQRGRSH